MIPISSGFSPVFFMALARAISAATSTGALMGRRLGDQGGKLYPDQPDHGGTGGTDKRRFFFMCLYVFPGSLGHKLRRRADFVYVVESQLQQGVQHNVHVGQVIVLSIEGRRRKSDGIFEIIDHRKRIIDSDFCVMRDSTGYTVRSQCRTYL